MNEESLKFFKIDPGTPFLYMFKNMKINIFNSKLIIEIK